MPDLSNPANSRLTEEQWEIYEKFTTLGAKQIEHNSHKGMRDAWLDYPLEQTLINLKMSVEELRVAAAYGIDVNEKAADVAVWAFIFQDIFFNSPVFTGLPTTKRFTGE